MSIKGKMTE